MDGAELRYVREGSGRACLIIGSALYYPRTFSHAFKRQLDCTFVSMRTFTPSAQPRSDGAYDMDVVADDIEAVRAALGLSPTIIVGHSMHALMAVEYARRYPANVTHLAMIGMVPAWGAETDHSYADMTTHRRMRQRNHDERQRAKADPALRSPGQRIVDNYLADGALFAKRWPRGRTRPSAHSWATALRAGRSGRRRRPDFAARFEGDGGRSGRAARESARTRRPVARGPVGGGRGDEGVAGREGGVTPRWTPSGDHAGARVPPRRNGLCLIKAGLRI